MRRDVEAHETLQKDLRGGVIGEESVSIYVVEIALIGSWSGATGLRFRGE